jgi:hypothetical protein
MSDPRLPLIPHEREWHMRSTPPSAYSADESGGRDGKDEGRLAFFTPAGKGGSGPSYVGPAPRRTRWQRFRAWWVALFGR